MNKLKKYIYAQNGYKSDKPITYPKLSKLEIDKINQANQKRLFEENQAQLSVKTTPTTQAVKNIGLKIDRDKRINSKQDKTNLLGLALSPLPVVGELYNSANVIADGIIDSAQGEYSNVAMSLIPYGLSKKINPNQNLTKANFLKNTNVSKAGLFDFNFKKPNSFQSEIDWGNWNKEIPNNSQLMKEYNAIEQQSKANNTWMKNPDGSAFQGTPEQFVQQNSENFKKSFPKGFNNFYRGDRVHHTVLNPDTNITFGGQKHMADDYTIDGNTFWKNTEHPEGVLAKPKKLNQEPNGGMYSLYQPKSNNNVVIKGEGKDWSNIPSNREFIDKDFLSTDEIALEMQKRGLDNATIQNIYDGTFKPGNVFINNNKSGNYLKSMFGNNGMFDMTNPNIYKSIVPIAGTAYMMNQNNKQIGGLSNNLTIVEDGEYVKDNQGKVGKITNIPSHDDNELIIDNQIKTVPKGKGGQGIYNVESVLSNSYNGEGSTNRNKSDNTYTYKDEEVTLKPQEALQLAEQLNLKIKRPLGSISPSKLMDKLLESRENLVRKYKDIDKPLKSERQTNSFTANVDVLSSIPTPEDIYDFIFSNQENSKSENQELYAKTGIHIDPSKRGTFSAQATRMGMSVQEAARTILNAPEGRYSPEMRKKANFAFNSKSWKHQTGGYVENEIYDLSQKEIQNLINQGYKIEYVN